MGDLTEKDGATVTLYARWRERGDIPYKVEHYVQDADGTWPGAPLQTTEHRDGKAGSWVTAAPLGPGDLALDGGRAEFDSDNPLNARKAPVSPDGSTVLKLYYNRVFTVRFDEGCESVHVPDQSVIAGGQATAPASERRPGYNVLPSGGASYWHTAGSPDAAYDFSTKVSADTELVAKWVPYTYTVSFDANGGSNAPSQMSIEFATVDAQARTLPDGSSMNPPTAGKRLAGWALSADRPVVWREAGAQLSDADLLYADPFNGTADDHAFTLHAVWEDVTYTVEYELDGGAYDGRPSLDPREVSFDSAGLLPDGAGYDEAKLVKTGHHLDERGAWVHGDGDAAKPVDEKTTYAELVGGDAGVGSIRIKPAWVANTYEVAFDAGAPAGEVTGEMPNQPFTYGVEQGLTRNQFKRPGYEFDGWSTEKATRAGQRYDDAALVSNLTDKQGGVVTLYAHWRRVDALWHDVTYRFDVVDGGRELPAPGEGGPALPTEPATAPEGSLVKAPAGFKPVSNDYGTWTFLGWKVAGQDAGAGVTMPAGGVEFTGEWSFEANKVDVTYRFEPADKGAALPDGVKKQKPEDGTADFGSTVDAPAANFQPVPERIDGVGGTWAFKGWSPDAAQIAGKDGVAFTGTWEWTRNEERPVTYEFTADKASADAGRLLPQGVTELLPAAGTAPEGSLAKAPKVNPESVRDGSGTWTFTGWDAAEKEVAADGVKFTGTWTWAENPRHAVRYEFAADAASIEAGRKLPEEAMRHLPPQSDAAEGTTVNAPIMGDLSVADGVGAWTFTGWDHGSQVMDADGVKFTGTWTWAENTTHAVSFEFVSGTVGRELPSEVNGMLPGGFVAPEGSTVSAPAPAQASVRVGEGTWTFQGWTPQGDQLMGDQDLKFTGTWTWAENPRHAVTYEFVADAASIAAGRELPQAVIDQLPAAADAPEGATVAAPSAEMTPVRDGAGAWTFVKWEPASQVMDADGVKFTGTWTWTEGEPRPVTHRFVSGTAGHELPQAVIDLTPASTAAPEGATVHPAQVSQTAVADGGGTWTFIGWDRDSLEVGPDGATFTGTWTWPRTRAMP